MKRREEEGVKGEGNGRSLGNRAYEEEMEVRDYDDES